MKLRQIRRYLELPIVGLTFKKVLFDGLLTVFVDDPEESFIQLHSTFKVIQHNQSRDIDPRGKEGLMLFYDLLGQTITEAKTDGKGLLWLTFRNGLEIHVEDGPYENWHYTKVNPIMPTDSLHVHGGIGRTTY